MLTQEEDGSGQQRYDLLGRCAGPVAMVRLPVQMIRFELIIKLDNTERERERWIGRWIGRWID